MKPSSWITRESPTIIARANHQDPGRLGASGSSVTVLEITCLFQFHRNNERDCSAPWFTKSHEYEYCSL